MTCNASRPRRISRWLMVVLAAGLPAVSFAAKPGPTILSDVRITFGGQTFGFAGPEESFSQVATGGRIVFQVRQLELPGYLPVPDVDVDALEPDGNRWVIETDSGKRSDLFVGTCASETFTTEDAGVLVRHLNLNCKDVELP